MLPSVKHALRVLRKDPGFTAVAICSLALGIGATSAGFSFADAIILRPLPIREPDRVVAINTAKGAHLGLNPPISYPDYVDLRDHNHSFEGIIAASYARFGFSPDPTTQPRMKFGMFVSGNFFRVLGVEPALGRGFRADEDQIEGRDAVVVLDHHFWVSQFRASPSIVGSHIRLNGIEFSIIGVAPERFHGLDLVFRPTLFVPIAMAPRMAQQNNLHNRDAGWLTLKARLKPGVTLQKAQADVASIAAVIEKLHKQARPDDRIKVQTEMEFRAGQGPEALSFANMLALLALCVMLVACANVAGLLLSRSRARSREIAVRLAIGAGRFTLVRQLLLENLLLAIAGGLGGIVIADAMAQFWRRIPFPSDLPIDFDIEVDPRALLFTLTASVLSVFLFGLAPALRASRPNLVPALKSGDADSGGKRKLWGRNAIVVIQVALSMVLLTVSALLVASFRNMLAVGPGYRTDHAFLTSFDTQLVHYNENQTRLFFENLLDRTRAAPGVRSAALVSNIPMLGMDGVNVFPEGWQPLRTEQVLTTIGVYASDGYFQTMDIGILNGRDFRKSDKEDSPLVAVVNSHMAGHYWPKTTALGKRFHLDSPTGALVEVVGVVKMSKYLWIAEPPQDFLYLPFRQHHRSGLTLVAESNTTDASTLAPVLRDIIHSLDPDMPLFDVRTMHDVYINRAVTTPNAIVEVVGGMGLVGLALAVVGLYGLVAYSVSRRTHEIAIRMAMGAERRRVVWMVLKQGLQLGTAGVTLGTIGGFLACRAVLSALWIAGGQESFHPLILPAIAVPLLLMTLLAAWAPARWASQVDPMRALRDE